MELKAEKRAVQSKGHVKELRRHGRIPANLYSKSGGTQISISNADFQALLRTIPLGQLSTTTLHVHLDGKLRRTVIKDVQYHPTTYDVIHIDFEELHPDTPVRVKVPIHCAGVVDCVGIKLGGFLRQVIRHIEVECDPDAIPSSFSVDVRELGIRQSKRLSHLAIPAGVRPRARMEEVVVVIARR